MQVFLGFSFRDEDKEIVELVGQLIASHLIYYQTGERLGGEQLSPAVQHRIERCDALIGIVTRRDQLPNGKWRTHPWVHDEIGWARGKNKKVIALVEQDVEVVGMFAAHEYVPLDKANPLQALMNLSETIGSWRREFGRTVKVQILPETIAQKVGDDTSVVRCRHRLVQGGKYTPWQDLTAVPEAGGTFVLVNGVQDDHLIQLQVQEAGNVWQSVATSQWIQVTMKSGGVGA
jgi:hypothetical protein